MQVKCFDLSGKSVMVPAMNDDKLALKHRRFADEYHIDLDVKRAAIEARYKETNAHSQGLLLLKRQDVIDYLDVLDQERSDRCKVSADRVIKELARIAFANAKTFVTKGDNDELKLVSVASLSDDDAAAISSLTKSQAGAITIKLIDKLPALDKLGRHFGLFSDMSISHTFTDMGQVMVGSGNGGVIEGKAVELEPMRFDVGKPANVRPNSHLIAKPNGSEGDQAHD